jgi:Leucine-rich repeat (LRR) protein
MKNQLLKTYLLLLFILTSLASFGQNINFPDAVFKQALLNYTPTIDTDGDGEITIQEASLVTALEISEYKKGDYFDPISGTFIFRNGISNFQGIENFINLISLICEENDLTSLDVSALTNLEYLDCSDQTNDDFYPGGLTSLILPNSSSLTYIDCSDSYLTSLDLSSHTSLATLNAHSNNINNLILPTTNSLRNLTVSSNQLSTLNTSNFTSIINLECSGNNLTSLLLPNTSTLNKLSCSSNQLTNIDLTPHIGLKELSCGSNLLTNIDLSQNLLLNDLDCRSNSLTSLNVSFNTELEILFCDNNLITDLDLSLLNKLGIFSCESNQLTSLNIRNGNNEDLYVFIVNDNPGLNLICVDDVAYANSNFDDKDAHTGFTENCSLTSATVNTITGTVSYDFDSNGCDPQDTKLININLRNTSTNTSSGTFTNSNGEYLLYAQELTNTLDIFANLPSFFSVTPTTQNVNFTGSGATQVVDFCIAGNAAVNDVKISVLPITESRPGFQTTVRVFYENVGSTSLSGDINLAFDDLQETFISASETTASQTLNSLSWNYANLQPFEQRFIDVTFEINRPTDPINPVNNGDILTYNCTINPITGDANPTDNTATLDDITIGSYDPNDIIALEGNFIAPNEVSNYLNYRIRFQNTGTASAINVVVKNELDSDLDWDTFEPITASHNYRVNITDDNKVDFIFENIYLPDSTTNEPASNGWIYYKIKPKSTFAISDVVENTANIYFDFNAPVITNTYTTEIKEPIVAPVDKLKVKVYPNPVIKYANIKVNLKGKLKVFNKYGVLVYKHKLKKGINTFDFEWLPKGRYFLKIISKQQVKHKTLIKKKNKNGHYGNGHKNSHGRHCNHN